MTEGPTMRKHFARGYQEGMHDVIAAYAAGGVNSVIEWLEWNSRSAEDRAILAAAVERINVERFGR